MHQTNDKVAAFAPRMERYFRPVHRCSPMDVPAMLENIARLTERRLQNYVAPDAADA